MSPHREGQKPKPVMHGGEKSDLAIVAGKPANEARSRAKEQVEPRPRAKENAPQDGTSRTPSRSNVSPALERVRQVAKGLKKERFTALLHHVTPELLGFPYLALKREAAPGVDGMTWSDYGQNLEVKLEDSHGRVHRGAYRAQPSRRRFIPKPDGRQRPPGIAALEDKIVQGALVEVLNAIYEEDFLGFSYGFRPGRGQHDALDALAIGIDKTQVNWILDADIAGFFDAVDHEWLIRFVELRIGDQRVIRLIRKWLKAGVMEEDGSVSPTEKGTPQGAMISPLLANIYLHYVFDRWAQQWRKRHAQSNVIFVRYADDIVVGFAQREEAESFKAGLHARMAQFALTLHPEKTRPIEFGRHAAANRKARGLGKPEPSTSWASRISAGAPGAAGSCFGGHPGATGCTRSSSRSRRNSGGAGTSRWRSKGSGYNRSSAAGSTTMPYRPTSPCSASSITVSPILGFARSGVEAKETKRHGRGCGWSSSAGCRARASRILGPITDSASNIQGGSRMREIRPYGSVRGARSNARPYRDRSKLEIRNNGLLRVP